MSKLRAVRDALVNVSRRYSLVSHEAEDLAHDIILSALQRGIDLHGEAFLRSARGAARLHGAFLARSAGRRRAREQRIAEESSGGDAPSREDGVEGAPLSVLSPTLRTTLLLLIQGLEKAELRHALGVNDTALRKRFQALRERGPLERPQLSLPERTPLLARLRRSQVELVPRLAAQADERKAPRVLAASDPDGHGVIFTEVLTKGDRTATPTRNISDASGADGRTRVKGSPCSTTRSRTSPSSSP